VGLAACASPESTGISFGRVGALLPPFASHEEGAPFTRCPRMDQPDTPLHCHIGRTCLASTDNERPPHETTHVALAEGSHRLTEPSGVRWSVAAHHAPFHATCSGRTVPGIARSPLAISHSSVKNPAGGGGGAGRTASRVVLIISNLEGSDVAWLVPQQFTHASSALSSVSLPQYHATLPSVCCSAST